MKKSRYWAERIAFALGQAERGTSVPEVCRKMGISEQAFYRWERRFVGLAPAEFALATAAESDDPPDSHYPGAKMGQD